MKSLSPSTDRAKKIKALERRVIRRLLLRCREWLKDHPEGLLPRGHPRAIPGEADWNMAKSALDLLKLMEAKK